MLVVLYPLVSDSHLLKRVPTKRHRLSSSIFELSTSKAASGHPSTNYIIKACVAQLKRLNLWANKLSMKYYRCSISPLTLSTSRCSAEGRLPADASRHHRGRRRHCCPEVQPSQGKPSSGRSVVEEQRLHRRVLLPLGHRGRIADLRRRGRAEPETGWIWKTSGQFFTLYSSPLWPQTILI